MVWQFKIMYSDHPFYIPFKRYGEPMSAVALEGCREWLSRCRSQQPADPRLLTIGLRQGHLLEAAYFDCRYGKGCFFTLPNREARFVSEAQLCVMRLMALPGRDCEWWFDRSTKKDLPDEEQRWYLRYSHSLGIWGLRIFADAKADEVVMQRVKIQSENHLGHKDLRPSNLKFRSRNSVVREGKPMRRTYRGRQEAIDYAVRVFGSGFEHLNLSACEYAALLAEAFETLDSLHGEEILRETR